MRKNRESKKIQYIRNLYAPENELLQKIALATKESGNEINIGAEEGKFLQLLISIAKAEKIVEIGTYYGYSTLWMADILPQNGTIISIEKNEKHFEIAGEFIQESPHKEKIDLRCGSAHEILSELHGPFDLVFIDADKISYPKYLEWSYENLKSGGIIIADNTLLFDSVFDEEKALNTRENLVQAMIKFNNMIADNSRFFTIMLPTEEGLTIAIKK